MGSKGAEEAILNYQSDGILKKATSNFMFYVKTLKRNLDQNP